MRRAYAKRRDANEGQIVDALQRCGLPVDRLDPPAPDLLVGTGDGRIVLIEVKDPAQDKAGGRQRAAGGLTPSQVAWHAKWAGYPIYVVRSPEEALQAVYRNSNPPKEWR